MTELQVGISLDCRTMRKDIPGLSPQCNQKMSVKTELKRSRKCYFTVVLLISRTHDIPSSGNWVFLCKAVFHNPKVQCHFGRGKHVIGAGWTHAYLYGPLFIRKLPV